MCVYIALFLLQLFLNLFSLNMTIIDMNFF